MENSFFRGDLSHACISETEALRIQISVNYFAGEISAPDRFLALIWRYDLISFTFKACALEIQNHIDDNGLKDDTHQFPLILDIKKGYNDQPD